MTSATRELIQPLESHLSHIREFLSVPTPPEWTDWALRNEQALL